MCRETQDGARQTRARCSVPLPSRWPRVPPATRGRRRRSGEKRNPALATLDVRRQHEHRQQPVAHPHGRERQPATQAGDGMQRIPSNRASPTQRCADCPPPSDQANALPSAAVARSESKADEHEVRRGSHRRRARHTVRAESGTTRPNPRSASRAERKQPEPGGQTAASARNPASSATRPTVSRPKAGNSHRSANRGFRPGPARTGTVPRTSPC